MTDMMLIASRSGIKIPGSVFGKGEKDRYAGPYEPIAVPRAYGEHVIHDRFAYDAGEMPAGNDVDPSSSTEAEVDPGARSKDELLAIAKNRGVEVKETATKAEIANAINAAAAE